MESIQSIQYFTFILTSRKRIESNNFPIRIQDITNSYFRNVWECRSATGAWADMLRVIRPFLDEELRISLALTSQHYRRSQVHNQGCISEQNTASMSPNLYRHVQKKTLHLTISDCSMFKTINTNVQNLATILKFIACILFDFRRYNSLAQLVLIIVYL